MTTSSLHAPLRSRVSGPPMDRRVLLAWGALFLNVLAFFPVPTLVPIPGSLGTLVTQGALALAFVLALAANPRVLLRPNLVVVVLSSMALVALMVSLHNEFLLGSTYRAIRFVGFVAVLWLLSPLWGRRDLVLLRCHRIFLWVVIGSVIAGAAVAPGLAFSFDGRLSGVIWPVLPTQVAHYAAVLMGSSVVLWMCRVITRRNAAVTVTITSIVLVATHTRTALLAGVVGLVCASASLLLARSRARRTWLVGALTMLAGTALFASTLTTWLLRDQTSTEAAGLTGRTKVWSAVFDHPRPAIETVFGSGMSNLSFDGLAIDSNWVGTYLDLGLFGLLAEVVLLLALLIAALRQPSGPGRAIAIFLTVYCIFSSITETGLSSPTPYLLDLAVASACLARPVRGASP
jgi:O-antigen ligase